MGALALSVNACPIIWLNLPVTSVNTYLSPFAVTASILGTPRDVDPAILSSVSLMVIGFLAVSSFFATATYSSDWGTIFGGSTSVTSVFSFFWI